MRRTFLPVPFAAGLLLPAAAFAQAGIIQGGIFGCDFTTGRLMSACIPSFIAHLIQFIFALSGTFFLINIMLAGFQMSIGAAVGGDRAQGKNRLIWSIVGFVVSACAFLILDIAVSVILG